MSDWDPKEDETQKQIAVTQLELLRKELARQEKQDKEEAGVAAQLDKPGLAETISKLIDKAVVMVPPSPSSNQIFGMCEQAYKGITDSLVLRHAPESVKHEAFGLLFSALERERVTAWAKEKAAPARQVCILCSATANLACPTCSSGPFCPGHYIEHKEKT